MEQIRICTVSEKGGVLHENEVRCDFRDAKGFPRSSWKDEVGASYERKGMESAEQLDRFITDTANAIQSLGFSLSANKASYDQERTKQDIASLCPR